MSALIVLYDGPLARDHWWPPTLEAVRVAHAARRLGHDTIRIERMGGALVREYKTNDVIQWVLHWAPYPSFIGPIESAAGADPRVSSALEPRRPNWAMTPRSEGAQEAKP